MRKTGHQIWKEAKEQNLSKEDFKQKLIDEGVIINKSEMRKEGKISRVAVCPICDCFVMASHIDFPSKESEKDFMEFSKQGYNIIVETGEETRNREMKDCNCKKL